MSAIAARAAREAGSGSSGACIAYARSAPPTAFRRPSPAIRSAVSSRMRAVCGLCGRREDGAPVGGGAKTTAPRGVAGRGAMVRTGSGAGSGAAAGGAGARTSAGSGTGAGSGASSMSPKLCPPGLRSSRRRRLRHAALKAGAPRGVNRAGGRSSRFERRSASRRRAGWGKRRARRQSKTDFENDSEPRFSFARPGGASPAR